MNESDQRHLEIGNTIFARLYFSCGGRANLRKFIRKEITVCKIVDNMRTCFLWHVTLNLLITLNLHIIFTKRKDLQKLKLLT